jgi:hypothetical protein
VNCHHDVESGLESDASSQSHEWQGEDSDETGDSYHPPSEDDNNDRTGAEDHYDPWVGYVVADDDVSGRSTRARMRTRRSRFNMKMLNEAELGRFQHSGQDGPIFEQPRWGEVVVESGFEYSNHLSSKQ